MSRSTLDALATARLDWQHLLSDFRLQQAGARMSVQDPVRILLLEDLASDAQLVESELRRAEIPFTSNRVWTLPAFRTALDQTPPDLILADYTLPQFTAIDALQALREKRLRIPFILVTGTRVEQVAVDCMREGADDYILKASLKRLPAAIQNAISRRRAEVEREAIEARYRLITENTRDLVVLVDEAGQVLYVSPSSVELLGYSPQDVANGAAACILHPDDRAPAVDVFRRALLDAQHLSAEVRCQHRDGEWRTFECRGRWIVDPHSESKRAVLILRDITSRKQSAEQLLTANAALEAREADLLQALAALQESHESLLSTQMQLIEAEKMESVGRLAAGVAHEVKNPLTVIVMGIEYLRKHVATGESDLHEVLHDMDEAIKRANRVVREMLDFSRPNTLDREDVSLNDVIEAALALLKHELGAREITVDRRLAADLPLLLLDQNKVEQVFVNILLNAAESIDRGGNVRVTTACRRVAELSGKSEVSAGGAEQVVIAEIDDTGRGVPADLIDRVFDPFFTTKPTGKSTGLGMTVMKRIVELHGGLIRIANRTDGQGARVTVAFPLGRRS